MVQHLPETGGAFNINAFYEIYLSPWKSWWHCKQVDSKRHLAFFSVHYQRSSMHISNKLWNFSVIFQHQKEFQAPVCGGSSTTLSRYISFLRTVSIYISWEWLAVSKQNAASPCVSVKNLRYEWLNKLASVVEHLAEGIGQRLVKEKCYTLTLWAPFGILILWIIILGVIQTNMNQLLLALQSEKLKCRKNRMAWSQKIKFAVRYLLCSCLGLMRPGKPLNSQCLL